KFRVDQVIPGTWKDFPDQVAALDRAFWNLNQVPEYSATSGPNSTTYIRQLLKLAGITVPDPRRVTGWDYNGPFRYGGPMFTENGNPTPACRKYDSLNLFQKIWRPAPEVFK